MSGHTQHETAPADRVPLRQKIGFGVGAMVAVIAINAVANLSQLYLNVGLKLSPVLVGLVLMLPRLWDAVTDPLVGHLSDNTRTRWGRRVPYIFVGALVTAVSYALLFAMPRGLSEKWMLVYFAAMSLLFYTGITIYSIPQNTLGLEMTDDYHERTRVYSYSAFFTGLGAFALPWFYWAANNDYFADEVEGLRYVGIVVGSVLGLCGIFCALVCREGKCQQAMRQKQTKFFSSFLATFHNRSFLLLISITIFVSVGLSLVNGFGGYVTIYYLYGGDKAQASVLMGYYGTIWAVCTLLGIYPMNYVSARLGKRRTMMLFLLVMAFGSLIKFVTYNRDYPYLSLLPAVFVSCAMLVVFTLGSAMMADVCDEEEVATGVRREGMYAAAYGWWLKLGLGLGPFLCGIILESTAFDATMPEQTEHTLWLIRLWDILCPSIVCLLAVFIAKYYPLTEERAYELKQVLTKRRAENGKSQV